MFCQEEHKDVSMPCSLKWVYEIISFISLICSLFVVVVTTKNIKMNTIHKLIIQIIVSEIIDEINILLSIVSDSQGKMTFENYDFRMTVCYSQIYLSVFSCLWTLIASLFISIKLYDIIINKNRIFKGNSFINKNLNIITIVIPMILTYIFYVIHVIIRSYKTSIYSIYINKIQAGTQSIKLIFCWLSKDLSIALACIVALLIIGNLYFSIFKAYIFLKKMKDNIIAQSDEDNLRANNRIKSISQIQGILFLYPLISCAIWIIFFLFIFCFYFSYRDHSNDALSAIFCVFMTIRQVIYTLVYFLSQKNLRKYTILFFKCQTCKRNKKKGEITAQINYSIDETESENTIND
jgi:hypothetical protein